MAPPIPTHCPACASEHLSGPHENATFEDHLRVRGRFKDARAKPSIAWFCLDCGYVMPFLSDADVAKLRDALG